MDINLWVKRFEFSDNPIRFTRIQTSTPQHKRVKIHLKMLEFDCFLELDEFLILRLTSYFFSNIPHYISSHLMDDSQHAANSTPEKKPPGKPKQCFQHIKGDLQALYAFLKQYRLLMRPSTIKGEEAGQFCSKFDDQLLGSVLGVLGDFIKASKAKLKAKNNQQSPSASEQAVSNNQQKSQSLQLIRQNPACQSPPEPQTPKTTIPNSQTQLIDKIILYTWQLCNARVIVASQLGSLAVRESTVTDIHKFCISTSRIYVSRWGLRHVTMQAMLITYFNLLKNQVLLSDPDRNGSICCLIEAILGDTIDSDEVSRLSYSFYWGEQDIYCRPPDIPIPSPTKPLSKKASTELQLQWFVFILDYCLQHCDHFLKSAYLELSNGQLHRPTNSSIIFLHFISLLLNKTVNDRHTTEMVRGYPCPIVQVCSMYAAPTGGKHINVRVSWSDFEWLMGTLLKQLFRHYKAEVRAMWEGNPGCNRVYVEGVMALVGVANCCNFLGGYNGHLQKRTAQLMMVFALEYLELLFLVYEIFHAKKRNIDIKIQERICTEYANNLTQLLSKDMLFSQQPQSNASESHKPPLAKIPLQEGQLVGIIRLLANLVHINPEAQQTFEQNLKYFRIIMSLTHEYEPELTMKNWAIVFLRNVSERSAVMRGELEKISIDVKVDNGDLPMI